MPSKPLLTHVFQHPISPPFVVVVSEEGEREKSKIPSFILFGQATLLLRTPLKYTTESVPAHSICRGGGRARSPSCSVLVVYRNRILESEAGNTRRYVAKIHWKCSSQFVFVLPLALKGLPFAVYYSNLESCFSVPNSNYC